MMKKPAKLLLGTLLVIAFLAAGPYALLYNVTHPPRDRATIDPADLILRTEDVTLHTSDGVLLSGWLVKGAPRAPVIILCHDLGGSRASLLPSAVSLNRAGFPLLVFDFRGHGLSGGSSGTLGVEEKRDVLGAVEFIKTRTDVDGSRIGLWGTGLGAYAGALAARDTPEITALALDSLYPDVQSEIDRLVRTRMPPAVGFVLPVLHAAYGPWLAMKPPGDVSLSGSIPALGARSVLLIVAAENAERYREGKALYAALPEGPQGGKNLLELKASVVTGLYADDKKAYDQAIVRFFTQSLPKSAGPGHPAAGKTIQVLER